MNDPASGYLVLAYVVTGVVLGGYLLRLGRRRRSLERRLERLAGQASGRAEEGDGTV